MLLLGMAFLMVPGQQPLVAFPLALPMGWTSLPPIFCAATEIATDHTNTAIQAQTTVWHHHLDALAKLMPSSLLTVGSQATSNCTKSLSTTDIFVDDHIALAQGTLPQLCSICQHLLQAIDMVFCPLKPSDHPTCQEPVLLKKLAKEDGQWSTQQIILGWLLDTVAMTIALPQH